MAKFEQWEGFQGKNWVNSVDVRDFIQCNYTPYDGDETFLEGPTEATDGSSRWSADRQTAEESIHALRWNQDG